MKKILTLVIIMSLFVTGCSSKQWKQVDNNTSGDNQIIDIDFNSEESSKNNEDNGFDVDIVKDKDGGYDINYYINYNNEESRENSEDNDIDIDKIKEDEHAINYYITDKRDLIYNGSRFYNVSFPLGTLETWKSDSDLVISPNGGKRGSGYFDESSYYFDDDTVSVSIKNMSDIDIKIKECFLYFFDNETNEQVAEACICTQSNIDEDEEKYIVLKAGQEQMVCFTSYMIDADYDPDKFEKYRREYYIQWEGIDDIADVAFIDTCDGIYANEILCNMQNINNQNKTLNDIQLYVAFYDFKGKIMDIYVQEIGDLKDLEQKNIKINEGDYEFMDISIYNDYKIFTLPMSITK